MDSSPIRPKDVLPHGEPFLFVDEIVSIEDRRIVASRRIPAHEPWTEAHFPGDPIVPGVLLVEGMAQTCGLLCRIRAGDAAHAGGVLAAIHDAKFLRPVRPGALVVYTAELRVKVGALHRFDTAALVGDDVVAQACLSLALGARRPAEER